MKKLIFILIIVLFSTGCSHISSNIAIHYKHLNDIGIASFPLEFENQANTKESNFRFSYYYNDSLKEETININTSIIIDDGLFIKKDANVQPLVVVTDSIQNEIDVLGVNNTFVESRDNISDFYDDWYEPATDFTDLTIPHLRIYATYEIDRDIIKTILDSKYASILFITDHGHFYKHFEKEDFDNLNEFYAMIGKD